MIVTCPACRTRYRVDEQALRRPGGRAVRCAGCGHIWHEAAPSIDISRSLAAPMVDAPRVEPPLGMPLRPSATARPPPRRRRSWPRFGLVVLIFLLIFAVLVGIAARGEIVAAWPATARLYALVGLAVQ